MINDKDTTEHLTEINKKLNYSVSQLNDFNKKYIDVFNTFREKYLDTLKDIKLPYNQLAFNSKNLKYTQLAFNNENLNYFKYLDIYNSKYASILSEINCNTEIINNLSTRLDTDSLKKIYDSIKINKLFLMDIISALDINNTDINVTTKDLSNNTLINEASIYINDTIGTIVKDELTENWQQKVKSSFDNYKKNNPVYAWIIMFLLTSLLTSFVYEPLKDSIKDCVKNVFSVESTYNNKKKEVRRILSENYSIFGEKIINDIRYINRDKVSIRLDHYMSSYSIITLNRGSIISLKCSKKNYAKRRYKNWLYVEYEAPDGIIYRGWINNIYTSKVM